LSLGSNTWRLNVEYITSIRVFPLGAIKSGSRDTEIPEKRCGVQYLFAGFQDDFLGKMPRLITPVFL
jgi:hypothetical protein